MQALYREVVESGRMTTRAFHDAVMRENVMPIAPLRLDLSRPGSSDRIVGREAGGAAKFPHLNELWVDAGILAQIPS